ncbi:MAG: YtxH domain-containing protein [Gemmatimonadaceae bacterium]
MPQYQFDDDEPYVIIEKHEGSIGSFLVGLAVGAGVALLLAPDAGVETRRRLESRARGARRAAQNLAEDVTDTVADTFQQARQKVEDRIESAREAIEIRKAQVTRAMEAGRAAADDARDELERRIAQSKAGYRSRPQPESELAAPGVAANDET